MLLKYLDNLKKFTTKEQFKDILKITEEDIKFNNIKFNKITNANEFIVICNRSLNIISIYS